MRVRLIATATALILGAFQAFAQDSEEREGGIVGTGIVGEIIRLGSIFVNDQKIEISDTMQVTGSVPDITAGDLKPGHTVAVVAALEDDIWNAQHIRQVLPLVGTVEAVGDQLLTILGTEVEIEDHFAQVTVGDWVAVSGFWQEGRVRASRLELLPDWQGEAQVSGTFFRASSGEPDRVGNTAISGIVPQHLSSGDLVRISGKPVPGGIEAERLETGLFDATVGIVQVEGYFSAPQPDGLYTVLGSGLVAYTDQPGMIDVSVRTLQCGANGKLGEFPTSGLTPKETEAIRAKLDCL
ncbi:DUF5666 domain-containing protein [Roseibium sp. SCPC15]|uniref:DUF5666 domain-containing protein n=1 Tax=Roseibium sp. SCP15 TaxID=3141376 RepID=UPI0033357F6D